MPGSTGGTFAPAMYTLAPSTPGCTFNHAAVSGTLLTRVPRDAVTTRCPRSFDEVRSARHPRKHHMETARLKDLAGLRVKRVKDEKGRTRTRYNGWPSRFA